MLDDDGLDVDTPTLTVRAKPPAGHIPKSFLTAGTTACTWVMTSEPALVGQGPVVGSGCPVFVWIALALVMRPDLLDWMLLWMLALVSNFYGRAAGELDRLDHAVTDRLKIARDRRRRAA